MAPVEELALLDFDRSNKGASKQRRDQINAEIGFMRDLLPLPESSRQRLSQLQIMSLTCVYIRKCNVLQKLFRPKNQESKLPEALDFFQALTGFILVTTREGKLLYISENVTDFLGHSMVDMKTQGDSLYDIVDKRDHGIVQAQLLQGNPSEDKDALSDIFFFCRMNMSRTLKRQSGFGDVKVMHVRGHFVHVNTSETGCSSDSQCVFMATCSPLITPDLKENLILNNTMVFKTVHLLDMTFVEVTKTAEYHLGYSTEELCKKSWYSMLHPEDIHEAKEKHYQLIRSNHEMGCMMTARMLRSDGSSFWVNIVMHVRQTVLSQNEEPLIVCINQVIDAHEAYQIKVQGHLFSMYPSRAHELWRTQLPAVTAPTHDPSPRPWIQQPGSNSVHVTGYPSNIPSYIAQGGRSLDFNNLCSPMIASSRVSKPAAGHPHFNPTSLVQSDRLKAMLKRKIQGPQSASCKPAKIPNMKWDTDTSNGGAGYSDFNHNIPVQEHYSQASVSTLSDCQAQTLQVLQPSNYRIGVMTAKKSHKVLTCQGVVSPRIPKMSSMRSEQVVPDVNVPESYLTPDPSPVSSPEPSFVAVKTEVMDPDGLGSQGKPSINSIMALQKFATFLQTVKPVKSQPSVGIQVQSPLPCLDPSDIAFFFDNLAPEVKSERLSKMDIVPVKTEIKMELQEEQVIAINIPNLEALKDERSSPDQCMPNPIPDIPSVQITHSQTQVCSPPEPFVPASPEALSFPCPTILTSCPEPQFDAKLSKKDILSANIIASSPQSTTTQESIDDLLSYFSDDGLEITPFQMDSRNSVLETSVSEDLLNDRLEKSYQHSFCMDSQYRIPIQIDTQILPEELSPQSTISSLAGEDDQMDDNSTFTLGMALSVIDAQDEMEDSCHHSLKDRDVLGMPDELKMDFILNSFVPSQGSLHIFKNGL